VRLVDTLSGTAAPSYTVLATAPSNYLLRGVALSPVSVPEPSSVAMLVGGGLALAAVSRRGLASLRGSMRRQGCGDAEGFRGREGR
jgi:hypothetical protein